MARILIALAALGIVLGGCSKGESPPAKQPAASWAEDAKDGDSNWPEYGRTSDANHYSPLAQINEGNVGKLKLAWSYDVDDLGSMYTAPIEVDGKLFFSEGLSKIHALDARTGKLLWKYDAEVGKVAGMKLRWGWGSRGIAYWGGKIFAGTLDGRLIALDANDGHIVWSVQTTEGPNDGRYITGAPFVYNGKVVIGHGGADFSTVRGYVTAYDANDGHQIWRFWTVPGDPAKGFENDAMKMAAKTWTGQWWKYGGGGTAWNAMAYDRRFNRLYIGTGNGDPWNAKIRSPGGGDNLFLSSIVAVDADTGKYVWHYQMDPGESWDYNASMDIELTDMMVGGRTRPVLMQAPKDGYFYVIDRETGKLLSAKPFSAVNWSAGTDPKTGRPIVKPEAYYGGDKPFFGMPGPAGGHNAQTMSYNPVTKLVYIPAQDIGFYYTDQGIDLKSWAPVQGRGFNNGITTQNPPRGSPPPKAYLLAWDPAAQKRVWSVPIPVLPGGGVTSTAGGLVLHGDVTGKFNILSARTGKTIWSFDAQSGISSQPISYALDGKQYITILSGYRGIIAPTQWDYRTQKRRVLTFVLDGQASLPPAPPPAPKAYHDEPGTPIDQAKAKAGSQLFVQYQCSNCHGNDMGAGGMAPDLRESAVPWSADSFHQVVSEGIMQDQGMPRWGELSSEQLDLLRNYIMAGARAAKQGKPNPYPTPPIHQ
ncbi:PQQ-dependent dehydrogenase, methanol/ethanol family [Sphingomonas sp. CGMCC 1.13654]|uniref:PQQ-dependent dehydrogenase, methanol/ethanol family n=1 Tax=Sphingomonas chungangi TaxID=2683589 RepID=A0A838L515_9SPHN|nr:PQQ-dependent dehydrogenase, methanol/ethanol family [Sphingomonas chungangi]MBA2933785.1 PQQ-dependent dehydrogenase, methanol/ethanol family [Sphingomonas chungangi]MVW55115.1 PQQ-dependent dehydrogenase, methanol/ethanol family [Sphingomonas chungangi]